MTTATAALTPRQREALALLAQGFTAREIGMKWDRSPGTVHWHIQGACEALGAKTPAHAVYLAVRSGEMG